MNKFLIILMLTTVSACRPLTTESPLILDIKKNMEANAENTIKLSKNVDKIADKIGLDIPSITPELKVTCFCRKPVNPDDSLIPCAGSCKGYFHLNCVLKAAIKKCVDCGEKIVKFEVDSREGGGLK